MRIPKSAEVPGRDNDLHELAFRADLLALNAALAAAQDHQRGQLFREAALHARSLAPAARALSPKAERLARAIGMAGFEPAGRPRAAARYGRTSPPLP